MNTKTAKQIIEDMDYSGGINWNKMLPPEDEGYSKLYVAVDDMINEIYSKFSGNGQLTLAEIDKNARDIIKSLSSFKNKPCPNQESHYTYDESKGEYCPICRYNSSKAKTMPLPKR